MCFSFGDGVDVDVLMVSSLFDCCCWLWLEGRGRRCIVIIIHVTLFLGKLLVRYY